MTLLVVPDLAGELELKIGDREERLTIDGVSWEQYELLLEKLGDRPGHRVTYLEGTLEIMSPSRRHEFIKKNIARLVEAYLEETRTPFWGFGSTTFRRPEKRGGTEPDECYCLETEKEFPDLAIEVVLTSGGLNKLALYKKLKVREVWFWKDNQFFVYHLRGKEYEEIPASELLSNLDLGLLTQYVVKPDPLEAVLEFRERIYS